MNLSKGTTLREAEKKVRLEKTNTPSLMPQIQEVKDSMSGAVNERLTPGGVVELRGYNLKIEGYAPTYGLWFVAETGEEFKATVIVENKPSRIIAMLPALRRRYSNASVRGIKTSMCRVEKISVVFGRPSFVFCFEKQIWISATLDDD